LVRQPQPLVALGLLALRGSVIILAMTIALRLPPPMAPSRWHRGFTLAELMVTVAIAAILAALAVPAMQNFLAAQAVEALAQELSTALRLARSEALKRGVEVSICAASATDASACAGAANWKNGWVVFYDYDASGGINGDDAAIRVQSGGGKSVKDVVSAASSLTYRRNGILLTAAGASVRLELQPNIASSNSAYAPAVRTVCVNAQGRVSISKGSVACP
jgi:type IV fimbrial biogenesis protein FimT